eukprot:gene28229-31410_t
MRTFLIQSFSVLKLRRMKELTPLVAKHVFAKGTFKLLLVIPPESDGLWEAIATGIQRLLMMNGGLTDIASADAAFADSSVTELLKIKAAEGGTAYAQMNKLALFAVNGEQEIEHLRDRISVLEETIQRLEENRIGTTSPQYPIAQLLETQLKLLLAEIDEFFSEKKIKVEVVQSQSVPGKPETLEDRLAKFERLQKLLTEAALLPPAPTTNNLLTVFDERLSRYEKMYKMLQDTSTVRRKMIAE